MKKIFTLFSLSFLFASISFSQDPDIDHWEIVYDYTQPLKYLFATENPDPDWTAKDYNDDSWPELVNALGYGGLIDELIRSNDYPDLGLPQTTAFYTRTEFTIEDTSIIEKLMLGIYYEDAYVAYINGLEVARANIGEAGEATSFDQYADSTYHNELDIYLGQIPPGAVIEKDVLNQCLVEGINVFSIEIHNDEFDPGVHNYLCFMFAGLNDESNPFYSMDYYFPIGVKIDSSNLPIVEINTIAGGFISDEPKITAKMKIINDDTKEYNIVTDSAGYDGFIGIELRGSSSMYNYPKKSYTIETRDALGDNYNIELLGMPRENDWVLYAPFGDKTLIRNVLSYKLSQDLGHYAPRTRFVELIKNGYDYGVYVLMEKIKQDKNRVNIAGLRPDEIAGDSLTGGYIIKIDKTEGNFDGWNSEFGSAETSYGNTYYQYVYPKYDEIVEEQKQYIQDFMYNFETNLRSEDFDDPEVGYPGIIDVESFIDYLIVNEVSKNQDGYRLSTFMYKDRDDNDGKLCIGPVWDYNLAFGNYTYCDAELTSGFSLDFTGICPGDGYRVPFWWDRLLQDENFTQQLRTRYDELRSTTLQIDAIYADIDSMVNLTTEARIRNYSIWQDIFTSSVWPINTPWADDYDGEIAYLKSWINDRLIWLDGNIAETRDRKFYVAIKTPGITEYMPIGVYPNPFVNELTLSIELEQPHYLQIDIYNLNGQKIMTLANSDFLQGYHELSWDGMDQSGNFIAPGMYIYTVSVDHLLRHNGKVIKR